MQRSVLVIDAEVAERGLLADALRKAGIEVLEAAGLDEALDLARDRTPDLLIVVATDLSEMAADEFTLALRTDPVIRNTRVVFLGEARDERELWRLASACGSSHVLIRPFAPDDVLRAIGKLLPHET
jgi:CheY-like chemotaxis protein